jgi:peptide chain release factor 2
LQLQVEKHAEEVKSSAADKKEIAFGSQIRSYVLHPYQMVKDHRTGEETSNTTRVLEGHIQDFIRAYLLMSSSEENEAG